MVFNIFALFFTENVKKNKPRLRHSEGIFAFVQICSI